MQARQKKANCNSREAFYYANLFVFQEEIEIKILPDAELEKNYAGRCQKINY